MNMKKTIAAIAAGAVAVSAMATTVSALTDTSFTYNLVKKQDQTWATPKATFSFTVNATANNYPTEITWKNAGTPTDAANGTWYDFAINTMTVKVASNTAGEQNKAYKYSTDKNSLNYNANLTNTGLVLSNELAGYTGELAITVTVETTDGCWLTKDGNAIVNDLIVDGDVLGSADAGDVTPTVLTAVQGTTGEGNEVYYPFMSDLNGESVTDRIADLGYVNAKAVLNDAIENYESVTFTFNTATSGIKWDDKGVAYYSSDDDADKSYMSFAQHLYTDYYNPENTAWTGFDWTGYNLFQGALVVNENWTMSLAETDYFDWTQTTLTFDWDAIMDGAMTSNSYATFLHDLKLATSNTWYWDSMTVTLTAGAAEDGVDAEAGVEADDEELTEEVVEEEVEEEVVEEVEEEVEVEVANPTTGNASVALAVIPVALAAAAVVAKKRS